MTSDFYKTWNNLQQMKMVIFRVLLYLPSFCENIQKKRDFISHDVLLQNRKTKYVLLKKVQLNFMQMKKKKTELVFKVYTKGDVHNRIYSV
jgi:hypothetical protein